MPPTEAEVRRFLEDYGAALGAGTLPAIVACWGVPAFVISEQSALPVTEAAQVEQFFAGAVAWYHAQGLVATQPHAVQVETLGDRLVSVDVHWAALDAAGATRSMEHSRYILSVADDDALKIRVAITLVT
jgi:hypothetical protein